MKKVLFLMLFLLILGAANVKAQVRIGSNVTPHGAAVLDLNADNNATPEANKGALALPRVSLANNTAQLNGTNPLNGMLVYNTGGSLSTGVYYWATDKWIKITDGSSTVLLDTIAGGGLTISADGSRVGIKNLGVTRSMLDSAASGVCRTINIVPASAWAANTVKNVPWDSLRVDQYGLERHATTCTPATNMAQYSPIRCILNNQGVAVYVVEAVSAGRQFFVNVCSHPAQRVLPGVLLQ